MIPDKILKGFTLCQKGEKIPKKEGKSNRSACAARVTTDCTFSKKLNYFKLWHLIVSWPELISHPVLLVSCFV